MVAMKENLAMPEGADGPFALLGGILSSVNVLLCILAMALPYWTLSISMGTLEMTSNIMMFGAEVCVGSTCASSPTNDGSMQLGGVLCIIGLFLNIFQAKTFLLDLPELDGCLAAIPCPFLKFHGFAIFTLYTVAFLLCTFGPVTTGLSLGGGAICLILALVISGLCGYMNFATPEAAEAPAAAAAAPDPEAAAPGAEATAEAPTEDSAAAAAPAEAEAEAKAENAE